MRMGREALDLASLRNYAQRLYYICEEKSLGNSPNKKTYEQDFKIMESIYDYIDRTIQTKLYFVWNAAFESHSPGPWEEYDFPIFFSLKNGGKINIYFADENDSTYTQSAGHVSYLPAFRKRQTELISTKSKL